MIGGYGCGKSSSVVFFIFNICKHYLGKGHVEVAIGVPTITLFDKTIWVDLRKYLEMSKSSYSYNKQEHILTIGNIVFIIINTEEPGRIYGVNPMIFICDELDELAQDVAMEAWVAINERTRNLLPDGRKPFMVFTTTAQGYKGTYQILETLKMQNAELKEQVAAGEISQERYDRLHNKWIHIRALTKNNTHLDPDYVDRLYLRYDENERLAFLEGHFVNLTTGRVYPEYDSEIHDIEPFEIDPSETVYIGQDLNVGFSKAVAFIKRAHILYIVRCFSFKTIVDAPYLMRSTFPTNPIEYFPDASANEILAMPDYRRELTQNSIQMRSGTVNPSILQRTFIQNKLFKLKRMFIFKIKENQPMMMALKVRQFDDKGAPEKGRGSDAPDHLCDSSDYAVYRIVNSDANFRDLKELAASIRTGSHSD